MQIYQEIFVGSSSHLHVILCRSRSKPPAIKVRGYLCNEEHEEQKQAACGCMIGLHANHDPPHAAEVKLPVGYSDSRIAILQTCKQIYKETIDLMYSKSSHLQDLETDLADFGLVGGPTFCFNNLEQPPFFILSALPDRLARIRNIQLCWRQSSMNRSPPPGSSLAKYVHKVGQCAFCNLARWLRQIQINMTGLRHIEIFMYLDKKMPVPSLGQSWIQDLLALQSGPDCLRKMKVKVFLQSRRGGNRDPWRI